MKARIARSSGVGYFSSAIDAVLAALDLLKNHGDEPEFRELLASTYALRASLWSDTEVFDHHSFRLAMRIWNQMLPEEPPLATRTAQTRPASGNGNDKVLGGKRPPVNVKRTGAKTTTKVPSKPTGLRLKQTEQNALPKSKLGASATLPVDPAKVADSTSSAFENIDQAFADARYAADVLGIQYHLADRIRMLRICLRMNSLRSDRVRVVAEAAALESLIGHSYLVLGYTGQSGLAYQRAKALVETHGTGDSLVDVRFYLGYSYYLSCIGNLDKR